MRSQRKKKRENNNSFYNGDNNDKKMENIEKSKLPKSKNDIYPSKTIEEKLI